MVLYYSKLSSIQPPKLFLFTKKYIYLNPKPNYAHLTSLLRSKEVYNISLHNKDFFWRRIT